MYKEEPTVPGCLSLEAGSDKAGNKVPKPPEAAKSEFAGCLNSRVVHDFNNILTAITGCASLLQIKVKAEDPNRLLVDRIVEDAERAACLVRNLVSKAPVDAEQTVRFALPKEKQPFRGTETVLLVEDHEALRAVAQASLRDYGYSVITAANGKDGLEQFRQNKDRIELILCDVVMPVMNGAELQQEIRKESPGTPILFMSGYTADIITRKNLLDSDAELILKPFTPAALVMKIRELLDRKRTRHESDAAASGKVASPKEIVTCSAYDGKRICRYMNPDQTEYEVRGNEIYCFRGTGQPVYEIRGDYIYEPANISRPVYEIRGFRYIHLFMWADQPLYEFLE